MKCLVTGGAGFIGSHLTDRLITEGYSVAVVDDLSTGKEININRKAKFYKLKIESPKLKEIFKTEQPDYIFHLAAQSQVKKSMDNPVLDAETNIIGTLNLLQLSLKYGVKKFIFSSSGGVMYGNTEEAATEDIAARPISPYGISKFTGEKYIEFYGREYGLDYCLLRYANVYGPRQDPHGEAGVVAIFTYHMLKNESCTLFGYGKMVRDYVYVADVIEANILSISKGYNAILNIGTGALTSVNELFEEMANILNYGIQPVYQDKRKGELDKVFLDYSRAQSILGWSPQISFSQGLEDTTNWFKEEGDL